MITAAHLRSVTVYDPMTGVFTARYNGTKWRAGAEVGTTNSYGYRQIGISGKVYLAHRLAWLYVYGEWPSIGIDHKNRCRADNRIDNLRLATQADQRQNQSAVVGAHKRKKDGKWVAQIKIGGKCQHIGVFDTQAEASAAYAASKKMVHLFNPTL